MTKKTSPKRPEFHPDDYVVYPAHGVGRILSIEEQNISGIELEMFVISFEKEKMTLRVPTPRPPRSGCARCPRPTSSARRSKR